MSTEMWLIVGKNGQLGRSMAVALQESDIPATFVGSQECDITQAVSVNAVVTSVHPGVIVNCAAWTAVDAAEDHQQEAFLVNCEGARNLARAARDINAKLIQVSTDYVFDGNGQGGYSESDPTHPTSVYGESKLCGERAVLEANPGATYVVRTAWLYSPYGNNFVKTMLRRALSGQPVRVVNDQRGQPTSALDLARHIVDLVTRSAPPGIYHGTNSGEATWFDFAREIFSLSIGNADLVTPVPSTEYPTKATRPANSVLAHTMTIHAGINEMRHWSEPLVEAMPAITKSLNEEIRHGS